MVFLKGGEGGKKRRRRKVGKASPESRGNFPEEARNSNSGGYGQMFPSNGGLMVKKGPNASEEHWQTYFKKKKLKTAYQGMIKMDYSGKEKNSDIRAHISQGKPMEKKNYEILVREYL